MGHRAGKIRIVAGTERGRLLKVPLCAVVRPTSEKVREAIFDVLGSVTDLRVLEVFAGTGAIGLEALSRGASSCVFVESDPLVASALRENIATLGYQAVCQIMACDYEKAMRELAQTGACFDLLFVDPPYRMLAEMEAKLTLLVSSLLADEGIVIVEGYKTTRVTLDQTPVFDRLYGDTRVTMISMRRTCR